MSTGVNGVKALPFGVPLRYATNQYEPRRTITLQWHATPLQAEPLSQYRLFYQRAADRIAYNCVVAMVSGLNSYG